MAHAITIEFSRLCRTPSDINEHLETLRNLASECDSLAEFGVRGVVSSYALAKGLLDSSSKNIKNMVCNDLMDVTSTDRWQSFQAQATEAGLNVSFLLGDSAVVELPHDVDLVFIDTFHVYGHLRRELKKHAPRAKKYIVMHDTTVDAHLGELIRCGFDLDSTRWKTGYSVKDLTTGLQPAIDEFLQEQPDWELYIEHEHNNGLTVLRRVVD